MAKYIKADSGDEFLRLLAVVAKTDVDALITAQKSYGNSWKSRGGVGAFMMLARKWDRMENRLKKTDAPFHDDGGRHPGQYDIFEHIEADTRAEGVIDDVRDLRRYLLLVEAELLARGHELDDDRDTVEAKLGTPIPATDNTPITVRKICGDDFSATEDSRPGDGVHGTDGGAPIPRSSDALEP